MHQRSTTKASQVFLNSIPFISHLIFYVVFYRAQSVQNLGLALIAMLAGLIVDMGGYLMLECFFLFCLGCKSIFFVQLTPDQIELCTK